MNVKPLVLLMLPLAVAVSLVACSSSAASPPQEETATAFSLQDRGEGGVTTQAVWVTPEHRAELEAKASLPIDLGDVVLVHLSLDTHSVDLAGYDLLGQTSLMGRERTVAPVRWVSISESSHHREGILAFPDGNNQVWASKEGCAELRLRQLAQVSVRSLRWEF